MARLELLTKATGVDSSVQDIFDGVEEMGLERFMNQFRALAHHPAIAKAIYGLLQAYYFQSVVPKKYLEMAILLVSNLNRCNYCVVHHTPPALSNGVSREQLQAIEEGTWRDDGLFDETEQTVLAYAEQMNTRKGRVDDSVFQALQQAFSDQQVVELTVRIGMCEFFNRFNEVLQLDIEPVAEALYTQVAT